MQTVSVFDPAPLTLLDIDVAPGATVRSNCYHNAPGMPSVSLELRVTIQGSTPVNLAVRYLGQDAVPATDTTRLLALSAVVPDTSALVADYAGDFLVDAGPEYGQVEVQNVSGGAVHVKLTASGSQAAAPKAASATAGHVVVDSLPSLPAGANAIGTVTVPLPTVPYHGSVTVATAGTRVQLASTQALKEGVDVEAHPSNIGLIYLGGITVTAANGRRLSAGQSCFVRIADLATMYIDASVSGEGASYLGV